MILEQADANAKMRGKLNVPFRSCVYVCMCVGDAGFGIMLKRRVMLKLNEIHKQITVQYSLDLSESGLLFWSFLSYCTSSHSVCSVNRST